MSVWFAVGLGSALGALARFALSLAMAMWLGDAHLYGTLAVNVLGAFSIGLLAELVQPPGPFALGAWARPFFLSGFCGGFTTFSLFGLETLTLWQAGGTLPALAYVAVSLASWIVAVVLGAGVGRRWAGAPRAARSSRSR
ncbi:MAG: fluoride efflux transporter FluC [Pseudomonadota bacterium]